MVIKRHSKSQMRSLAAPGQLKFGVRVVLGFGIAWGITGANPVMLLEHGLTGHGMIQSQITYDEHGNLVDSREVFRLGNSETLVRCIEIWNQVQLSNTQEETNRSVGPGGTDIFTVRCPPVSAP